MLFSLPAGQWRIALDSSGELSVDGDIASSHFSIPPHAVVVLRFAAS
jgi:hypothetical protein